MTLSRELAMRFHDGELSEAEALEVEAALEARAELLEELEAYSQLGNFVRAASEHARAESAPSFDISESVMAAIAPAPPRPLARVHSLWPRVAGWVSLGAAVAAGSLLVIRSWSAPHASTRGSAHDHAALAVSGSAAPSSASALQAPAEEEASEQNLGPATIETVDFGSNTGTVFVVSTDSSETPVVWMPDDAEPDEDNEDRSESL